MTEEEKDKILNRMVQAYYARKSAEISRAFHELVDPPAELPYINPEGIRCDTPWCVACHDHRLECGDRQGPYTGMVHRNRWVRMMQRERGEPYESGLLFVEDLNEEAAESAEGREAPPEGIST